MKRRRLKWWVKPALTSIAILILTALMITAIERYNRLAKECDNARGYICTHYDIHQYSIGR